MLLLFSAASGEPGLVRRCCVLAVSVPVEPRLVFAPLRFCVERKMLLGLLVVVVAAESVDWSTSTPPTACFLPALMLLLDRLSEPLDAERNGGAP